MGLPQVAIVGRPNVGKSSLFNWLAQKRLAIVDDQAGVTRDRLSFLMCHDGRYFELVDTGGIGCDDVDNLTEQIEEQIQAAIDSADVILFVVDTQTGAMPLDDQVAKRLRHLVDTPVLCVANKTDNEALDPNADAFYKLGRGRLVRTSVTQNRGRQTLLDLIVERLPATVDVEENSESVTETHAKIAIVGRRNVGKSTFINELAGSDRVIVSEIPGTTRDSVDVRFEIDGKVFTAIDTPGLRRRKSVKTDIDFYGLHRAQRSIRRSDVVLMFFDAGQRISKVDKQLCDTIASQYKPCIFVVNKWDLNAASMPTDKWVQYLHDTFRTMPYVPIAFITAKTGRNVKALVNHAQMLFKQSQSRAPTALLNKILRSALEYNPPPLDNHHQAKIYYATQVSVRPPTIVMFCKNPKSFAAPYRRYLLRAMRDNLECSEVPIKLYLRSRDRDDARDEVNTAPK
ncbi:MAG: ribosome biogenesis GTPase Der [Planctomycetota bacterium]|nr:ribosome biogenesis GTPase Der [Planctomycetota bacterium]MEC8337713.1 ribosome biogenesis GTPase Der [Planctomycetota bacterium]